MKLRGFRIEPGEIESVLLRDGTITRAAVVIREDRPGDKRLVAYLVPAPATRLDLTAVRAGAAAVLPDHMVPSAFVELGALPLTPNGKLDRRNLPEPHYGNQTTGRAPRTPTEGILCGLFADVLGLSSAGVEDNFFHRGGHSLLATRLIRRIRAVWDNRITIHDLFQHPTPAQLAAHIVAGTAGNPLETVLPIRPVKGGEAPLFCVHPISGMSWGYAGLLRHVGDTRPVIGLQARRLTEPERRPADIIEMARDYLTEMRRIQPHGPYHLIGWSFGGMVAHAMAALLRSAGEEVALLALLDAYPLPEGFRAPELTGRDVLRALFGEAGAGVPLRCAEGRPDVGELAEAARTLDPVFGGLDAHQAAAVVEATLDNLRLRHRYVPDLVHDGDVLFFGATRTPAPQRADVAWAPHVTGRVEEIPVDCEHAAMTEAEPLRAIGRILAGRLRPARI